MKKHELKSQQQKQETEQQAAQQASHTQAELEFASVEELLRHDARQNLVPPQVSDRLEQSLKDTPIPPPLPWWKRILGP